jgi:hypothetical protein
LIQKLDKFGEMIEMEKEIKFGIGVRKIGLERS